MHIGNIFQQMFKQFGCQVKLQDGGYLSDKKRHVTRPTSRSDRIYVHFGMIGLSEAGKLTTCD